MTEALDPIDNPEEIDPVEFLNDPEFWKFCEGQSPTDEGRAALTWMRMRREAILCGGAQPPMEWFYMVCRYRQGQTWAGFAPEQPTIRRAVDEVACPCGKAAGLTCLGCGRRWCADCQEGGGAPCVVCHGPAWRDDEEKPPGLPNPGMGDH